MWGRDERGSNSNVTGTPGCRVAALWCAEWGPLPPHHYLPALCTQRWIWHFHIILVSYYRKASDKYICGGRITNSVHLTMQKEKKRTHRICSMKILFAVLKKLGSGFIVSDTHMFIELLIFLYVWLSLQTSISIIYSWISKLTKNNSQLCISQRYKCLNSLISYLKKK